MFDSSKVRALQLGTPYNCRTKWYGDEVGQVMACNKPIFTPGLERPLPSPKGKRQREAEVEGAPADKERARRRARSRLFDLAYCNKELCYFWTLTLDPARCDRYDVAGLSRRLNTWLDNMVRRHGLKYILVTEKHKDGALHYHGLMNGALRMVDSGTKWERDGQWKTVWNTPDWKLGFSTGVEITGERTRACRYVAKYISKSTEMVGGRYFRHGGALAEPGYTYANVDYDTMEYERMFDIKNTGMEFKIL